MTQAKRKVSRVYYRTFPRFVEAKALAKELARTHGPATDVKPSPTGGFDVYVRDDVIGKLQVFPEAAQRVEGASTASFDSDTDTEIDYREVAAALDRYAVAIDEKRSQKAKKPVGRGRSPSRIAHSRIAHTETEIPPSEVEYEIDYREVAAALESYAMNVDSEGRATIEPIPAQLLKLRQSRDLIKEIQIAYRSAPAKEIEAWAIATAKRFPIALTRRVSNLGRMATTLVQGLGRETLDLVRAIQEGRGPAHIRQRTRDAGATTSKEAQLLLRKTATFAKTLRENPKKVGPELLVMSMAFYYAGGGFDGDGGIPDQDIRIFGIGGHRSIWTHSILAGAFVETGLFSLYDFLLRAHKYLPKQHDPIWDVIKARLDSVLVAANRGSSLGIAYHLGIDATLQPAAYHDLPFSASMDVHREIMGANALAEGINLRQQPAKASDAKTKEIKDRRFAEIATGAAAVLAGAVAVFVS